MATPENLLVAVDPGPNDSAFVVLDANTLEVVSHGIEPNLELVTGLKGLAARTAVDQVALVLEMPKSYGNIAGDSIFETCVWVGRFMQTWRAIAGVEADRLPRKTVVTHLCHNPRAGDANVRRALLDKYPQTGGGREPACGTKSEPGPLYGLRLDEWQALGLGVAFIEMNRVDPALEKLLT